MLTALALDEYYQGKYLIIRIFTPKLYNLERQRPETYYYNFIHIFYMFCPPGLPYFLPTKSLPTNFQVI